jgi:hypothetical protein
MTRPWQIVGLALVASAAAGCARPLNMSRAYDAQRPALTVPYTAVREETRLYPDYNPITATILTEGAAPAKKGK